VVRFDSTIAGTTAAVWDADERLAAVSALSLDGVENLVVVAAHPDDETLGAGGLIAECASRGIRTLVVIVTDGAASHPDSPTATPSALAARRADEVRAAVSALSPQAAVLQLGHPDGGAREAATAIAADLERAIPVAGSTTLLVAPWRGDGHRDHRVVGEVCAAFASERGVRLLEYPIWLWHWAHPGHDDVPYAHFARLELSNSALESKHRAIAAHDSQVLPLSDAPGDEALLAPEFVENFAHATEYFVEGDAR